MSVHLLDASNTGHLFGFDRVCGDGFWAEAGAIEFADRRDGLDEVYKFLH